MEKEAKALRADTLKLVWHMRGSVSYTDAMNMSVDERMMISDLIKENFETVKKTGLPYF